MDEKLDVLVKANDMAVNMNGLTALLHMVYEGIRTDNVGLILEITSYTHYQQCRRLRNSFHIDHQKNRNLLSYIKIFMIFLFREVE